jgi:starch synthase
MARRIVAGSDFTLMPSRFEPCGLAQMQAQRYGALPIAHATGGLADTIDDGATGFLFETHSADGLMQACHRAFDAYQDNAQMGDMRRAAMGRPFGWSGAAAQYEALYRRLIGKPAWQPAATRHAIGAGPGGAAALDPAA